NEELLQECDTVNDPEDELDSEGFDFIDRVTDFQRLLAPPPQTPRNGMSGEVIFNQIGCIDCHTKTFVTSEDNSIMEPLRGQTIHPYSDFLLHDMGISGDGIAQGGATGRELKTPPLWGLAYRTPLWHDGRIDIGNFEVRMNATINEHGSFGSQGQTSTSAFNKLSPIEQSQLFAFLKSLGQVEFDGDSDGDVELDDFHGYSDTIGFRSCFEVETTPDDPCAIHDINQDGIVNLDDFDLFVVAFDDELADCNENGTTDMLDILLGADDNNNNGILDYCETCLGDVNGDNALNVGDILAIIDAWGLCDGCAADVNSDGTVNVTDLLFIVGNWGPC
ncbi:MAG: di-heme oxidoredictase family protein, partial [Planctomycetota bacterium]|nr:di-heme oxidoredictase family protein [Planctomycetota bacterium]